MRADCHRLDAEQEEIGLMQDLVTRAEEGCWNSQELLADAGIYSTGMEGCHWPQALAMRPPTA